MPASLLQFDHQDGALSFSIERASYHLSEEGTFCCSISCKLNHDYDYMSAPCFAAHNFVFGGAIRVGQVLELEAKYEQSQGVEVPRVHLYAGAHYDPWNTRLEVVSIEPKRLGINGSFMTQDPNYYDARAENTRATFFAVFVARPVSELWSPY